MALALFVFLIMAISFLLRSLFLSPDKCIHLWDFKRNEIKCMKCHERIPR